MAQPDWRVLVGATTFPKRPKELELPGPRLHDLRHTHATLLLKAGRNVKVVSERLGQANITITLATYGHVSSGMQEGAAAVTDKIIDG